VRVTHNADRLVTVVFTVLDLDRAVKLYTDAFGLDFHVDDHHGDDLWTSGRHAAISWTDGEYMHFALYESKDGTSTRGAQIAFRVDDLDAAHDRAVAAGAQVLHGPKRQPWGTSARYQDADGNVIELTQHG
jgi:predicted enzyme related to lactoylglutathione lyase